MKGLILFSNGMEDSEGLSTLALLRRAKITVDSASTTNNKNLITGYNTKVETDYLLSGLDLNNYDFLVVPGGGYVDKIIDKDVVIKDTIKYFYNDKKIIAAICAAPRFLDQLGILDNIKFTAFPGSEKDAPKGIYEGNKKALTSGNIITGRSAGAVVEFTYEIVNKLKGENEANKLLKSIIY